MANEKTNKTKIVFDVINSVKGGSGKSTFALGLAYYLIWSETKTKVFIIDLDLRGSSWAIKYKNYITKDNEGLWDEKNYRNYPFINRLVTRYDHFEGSNLWSHIDTKTEDKEDSRCFYLCPADDQYDERIDEIEIDMFEHMIYRLIKNGLKEEQEKYEEIHFILDMPPSYESHAERILKHLLTSINSNLYQNKFLSGNNDSFDAYIVRVFMMAAISQDHIVQNNHYIDQWIAQRSYSSAIISLLEQKRLVIQPILNDVTNITTENEEIVDTAKKGGTDGIEKIREELSKSSDPNIIRNSIKDYGDIQHFSDIGWNPSPKLPDRTLFLNLAELNYLKTAIEMIYKDL